MSNESKTKANQKCPECGSDNTWFRDVKVSPEISDVALYCKDCNSQFT